MPVNKLYLSLATGSVLLVHLFSVLFFSPKSEITINFGKDLISISTSAKTVGEALGETDIILDETDIVDPSLDSSLKDITQINIERAKPVFVVSDGTVIKTATYKDTVKDILNELDIEVYPEDTVKPLPDKLLKQNDYNYILIKRAKEVTLQVGYGETQTLRTTRKFVYQVLMDNGVALNSEDRVKPSPNCPVVKGTSIEVTRVDHEVFTEDEVIPYEIVFEEDPSLPEGQTLVIHEGKNGLAKNTIKTYYKNDFLTSVDVVDREVISTPVDKVILIGTDTHPEAQYVLTMEATAYYPGAECCWPYVDGLTASGTVAGYGVVAVDPYVIPLGSRVYIEGYGYAIASDTGGAIIGHRIDLCYDTYWEAVSYGRKRTDVYVLY